MEFNDVTKNTTSTNEPKRELPIYPKGPSNLQCPTLLIVISLQPKNNAMNIPIRKSSIPASTFDVNASVPNVLSMVKTILF